jgi:hypothetical protein
MIKAIVVGEVSVLDGSEAMELGVRMASETEYKYVWYRDDNRLILGNVPWSTVDSMGGSGINGILEAHGNNRMAYTFGKGKDKMIHIYDWGNVVDI